MHIPIHVPIGAKYVASVQGAVWKLVSCASCNERFAYLLELKATGEGHDLLFLDGQGSAECARAKAEENLLQQTRNIVLPIPCPNCGIYQDDMTRRLKEEAWINPLQVTGAVIVMLSLVPLTFDISHVWILTVVLALAGLVVLAWGYVVSLRFDPNTGDPELRKALGRKHAVWGEQLADLLATSPLAKPDSAPDGSGT